MKASYLTVKWMESQANRNELGAITPLLGGDLPYPQVIADKRRANSPKSLQLRHQLSKDARQTRFG